MLIYFFVLAVPLAFGLLYPTSHRPRAAALWPFFFLLLFFCGLRLEVGADWGGYLNIFDLAREARLQDGLSEAEPGFFLLNWLSEWCGVGFVGVVFVSSLIFLYGCVRYAQDTWNPWLALAVVIPYLVFIISMSGMRQACAIGIGFLMLARWRNTGTFRKLALILLAASFHNSAVVLTLFLIFGMKRPLYVRAWLTLVVIGAVALSIDNTSAERYRSVYIEENLVSEGALFHVLLTAVPAALYLIFRRRLQAAQATDPNVLLGCVLTLASLPLLAVSSTGIDRLTLYFSFVQMWTYPALLRARVVNPMIMKFAIAVLVLTVFVVYFQFGTHAFAYLPYRNVLFD